MVALATRNKRSRDALHEELDPVTSRRVGELGRGLLEAQPMLKIEMEKLEHWYWSSPNADFMERELVRRSLMGQTLAPDEQQRLGKAVPKSEYYLMLYNSYTLVSEFNKSIQKADVEAHRILTDPDTGLSARLGRERDRGAMLSTMNEYLSNSLDKVRQKGVDPFTRRRRAFERMTDRTAEVSRSNLYTVYRFIKEVERDAKKNTRSAGNAPGTLRYDIGRISPARDIDQQKEFALRIARNIKFDGAKQELFDIEVNLAVAGAIDRALDSIGKNGVRVENAAESLGRLSQYDVSRLGLAQLDERVQVLGKIEQEALLELNARRTDGLLVDINHALMEVRYGKGVQVDTDGNIVPGTGTAWSDAQEVKDYLDRLNNERIRTLAEHQVYMGVMDLDGRRMLASWNADIEKEMLKFGGMKPFGLDVSLGITAVDAQTVNLGGVSGQRIYTAAERAAFVEAQTGARAEALDVLAALGTQENAFLSALPVGMDKEVIDRMLENQRQLKDKEILSQQLRDRTKKTAPDTLGTTVNRVDVI